MGEVYRARDSRLEREVALKVLPTDFSGQAERNARFLREMKVLAALSHPNLLAIFDTGVQAGQSYAITELLEGETLRARLKRGALPWREATELASGLADGLATAHERGIVHRDIKPDNIFLTRQGGVKLLDFGLARMDRGGSSDAATVALSDAEGRTQPGILLGTPGYLSPEQARGEEAGAPSDLFAWGCVLHEMISGRRAFAGGSLAEALAAVLHDNPKLLAVPGSGIPAELDQLLSACLQKNPALRPTSARDLVRRCRVVLGSGTVAGVNSDAVVDSIAVLAFANPGNDADADYLCEGIAENIMNRLSGLRQLRVTPRSVAFRFKPGEREPLEIGRELGVRAVLSGRLQQRAGTLILGVELADVATGTQLWGQRFRRPMTDIFELEEELAAAITETLRVQLSGAEQDRMEKRPTQDAEAYQLYLRGRHHWIRRSMPGMQLGVQCFQQAIEKDPGFALAYAGLADCYSILGAFSAMPARLALLRGRAAAAAAQALDLNCAEAHTSMGLSLFLGMDLAGAEAAFRRGLELNPAAWATRYWLGYLLGYVGHFPEAEEQYRAAEGLDPLNPLVMVGGAMIARCARRTEMSLERLQRGLASNPDHPVLLEVLALNLADAGRSVEAVAAANHLLQVAGDSGFHRCIAAAALARAGETERASALLEEVRRGPDAQQISLRVIAVAELGLGRRAAALDSLEGDARAGQGAVFCPYDPGFDELRDEPRFQAVMRHWLGQEKID